ncbi:MAG: hypothetical protein OES38_18415 [Gammaproteobacteria bacterium]|nr:hypothetical protein [Gammaproteobacteria bacterium]
MRDTIIKNLTERFQSYDDFVGQLSDDALAARLDAPKHKSIAEHLWCVVGARESYAKALEAGEWSGFGCSMSAYTRADFEAKLPESARTVVAAIDSVADWTAAREELLATLAEHEVMHEGQIIRHVYGVEGTLPVSWKWA